VLIGILVAISVSPPLSALLALQIGSVAGGVLGGLGSGRALSKTLVSSLFGILGGLLGYFVANGLIRASIRTVFGLLGRESVGTDAVIWLLICAGLAGCMLVLGLFRGDDAADAVSIPTGATVFGIGGAFLFVQLLDFVFKSILGDLYRTQFSGIGGFFAALVGLSIALIAFSFGSLVGAIVGIAWSSLFTTIGQQLKVQLVVRGHAIRTTALRRTLQHAGILPAHLARFLDYATDHVLLQKVGGSYRFIHILLRDYFADLSTHEGKTHVT
jgi:hypothetical protein